MFPIYKVEHITDTHAVSHYTAYIGGSVGAVHICRQHMGHQTRVAANVLDRAHASLRRCIDVLDDYTAPSITQHSLPNHLLDQQHCTYIAVFCMYYLNYYHSLAVKLCLLIYI